MTCSFLGRFAVETDCEAKFTGGTHPSPSKCVLNRSRDLDQTVLEKRGVIGTETSPMRVALGKFS